MKKKCKNCKWWVVNDIDYPNMYTCDHPKVKKGYRFSASDMPDDGAWIENDEGWAWYVGPEYGCVNFEEKE